MNSLNITQKEAIDRFSKLCKETIGIPIIFTKGKDYMGRTAYYNENGKIAIYLNLDKMHIPILHKNEICNDINFITGIATIFHEMKHYEQYKNMKGSSNIYLLSHVACYNNFQFYLDIYLYDKREIEAEYFSFIKTYEYLQNEFSDLSSNVIDDLYLAYMNSRLKNCKYFITPESGNEFQSLQEIERLFKITTLQIKENKSINYMWNNKNECKDDIYQFLYKNENWRDAFSDAGTNIEEKIKMFASLELRLCPELLKYFPELNNKNMSTEKTWGIKFTEENYQDFIKNINLDDVIKRKRFDADEIKDKVITEIVKISNRFSAR